MADEHDVELLQKKISYYKTRLDEMAGKGMQADYQLSGLRHSLKQKEQAFSLLSNLQTSIGAEQTREEVYEKIIETVNGNLTMDKSVILTINEKGNAFRVSHLVGFQAKESKKLKEVELEIPKKVLEEETFLCNGKSEKNKFSQRVKDIFNLPYFLVAGVIFENQPIAVLITGRLREAKPLYPPLDEGDKDTIKAIVGFMVATFSNMKFRSLQKLDQMKTKFFANISHEFRTPITLSIGPLEKMLSGGYGKIPTTVEQTIEIIIRNQNRLLNLINQILDLSKLEAGKMELAVSLVKDMGGYVEKRVEQFKDACEKKGLFLKLENQIKGIEAYIDREKIETVLFNLLSNAFKFTRDGGLSIRADIENEKIIFSVSDTGMGIAADQISSIFDRYSQNLGSYSKDYAGTGIGLALVKEIIELHGGTISVDSHFGEGTTFCFTLPLGRDHLDPSQIVQEEDKKDDKLQSSEILEFEGEATRSHIEEIQMLNEKSLKKESSIPLILYAEDNPDMRKFVYSILDNSFRVLLAPNGKEGFELALKHDKLKLIISDLMMPTWSGTDFLQNARSSTKLSGIPFILLTAKTELETKILNLAEGVDDYLNKPFSEAELIARVKNLVKIREQSLKIKSDLIAARDIQRLLVGPQSIKIGEFDFETLFLPCDDLSGDFYDIIQTENFCYFYVADVESHGVASAQITYLIKRMVQEAIEQAHASPTISEVLGTFAEKYLGSNLEKSVVAQMARLCTDTGRLQYATSGMLSPLLKKSGKTDFLSITRNPYIASTINKSLKKQDFSHNEIILDKGDSIYFFTDGTYEIPLATKPNTQLGPMGFKRLLEKMADKGGGNDQVLKSLRNKSQNRKLDDDLTLLTLSRA